jgi:hypothetical protein
VVGGYGQAPEGRSVPNAVPAEIKVPIAAERSGAAQGRRAPCGTAPDKSRDMNDKCTYLAPPDKIQIAPNPCDQARHGLSTKLG